MALIYMLSLTLILLTACAPTPPPSCHGPVGVMNQGEWAPVTTTTKAP